MRRTLVEIELVRDLTQRQTGPFTGKHVKNCQRPIQHLDLVGRLGRCLRMWHDVALYERLMQCQQKFYRGIGSVSKAGGCESLRRFGNHVVMKDAWILILRL